jgi:hypothetical protein
MQSFYLTTQFLLNIIWIRLSIITDEWQKEHH